MHYYNNIQYFNKKINIFNIFLIATYIFDLIIQKCSEKIDDSISNIESVIMNNESLE